MIKNILFVLTIMLSATLCNAQGNQVGTYYFIMAHDDYHERRPDLGMDHSLNARFKGENYIGFQNTIYYLDRGSLKVLYDITEFAGRNQHSAHRFLPSIDKFVLMTNKLFVYNLSSQKVELADSVLSSERPGRYSPFYSDNDSIFYSNDDDNAFVNLLTLEPTKKDLRTNYLGYIYDGSPITLNLFPFGPNIFFNNDTIYGYNRGKRYPIKQAFSWPEFVIIDRNVGRQTIKVNNNHLLLLVKWLTGENKSTSQYSLYNKLKDKWAKIELPETSPIRYQNGWLIGLFYDTDSKCSTTVSLDEYKTPKDLEDAFFSRYTLRHGLWPNLRIMYCQHFIYHVDSESMGVVNLDDHDSEILYVFDDRVVYRIYDRILEAPILIVNKEIYVDRRSEKLLVHDKDIVPNIHYMYVNSQE
jgi:hypothetical protein